MGQHERYEWNARHTGDEQLVELRIIHMNEKTLQITSAAQRKGGSARA